MKLKDGDSQFDCLALLDVIYRENSTNATPDENSDRWKMYWKDLVQKSVSLDDGTRQRMLLAAITSQMPRKFVPADWRPIVSESSLIADKKIEADAMIFCVIEQELNSTLAAFGINQLRKRPDMILAGHRFYRLSVRSKNCGVLKVWVGLIGEARNVVCANFCRDVFERFSIKYCCLLVGIAGGNKEKVRIGDVVGSEVVDIEGARVEPRISKPRHRHYPISSGIRPMLTDYEPTRWDWIGARKNALAILKETGSKISKADTKRQPNYKPGSVLTGEKLRRDGKLPALARRFGDKFLAIEMEGSGFAASCDRKKINWLVFRGISDYGDMKKRDKMQPLSALHAALAARTFLINALRPHDEIRF